MKMTPTEAKEPRQSKGFHPHEIESMANTLLEAEHIKSDSKKMDAVGGHLKKKKKAITSIEGLRSKRKELQESKLAGEDKNPDEAAEGEA